VILQVYEGKGDLMVWYVSLIHVKTSILLWLVQIVTRVAK